MFNLRPPLDDAATLPWENEQSLDVSNSNLPPLSVVIPIYNSGVFLEKTIRSLLCNDLTGVELILMDGGSSDNTMNIVDHYSDIFTIVVSEADKGQSDAINKGFGLATANLLYWLNGDDLILPNCLSKVRKYFLDRPRCQVLVGNAYMTELDLSPIKHFKFSPEKLKFTHLLNYSQNHLVQPSVFFSRAAWEASGPLDINDHYAMDADLFIGMASDFEIEHIDIDVAYSVYHEDCKTRGARAESITSLALAQAKYGGFEQAKSTLDILVGLYNKLKPASSGQDPSLMEGSSKPHSRGRNYQIVIAGIVISITLMRNKAKVKRDC